MSAWRLERQIIYSVIFGAIIFGPLFGYLYLKTPDPTCFDGKKNQDEFDIDCGGSCAKVCEVEVASFVVDWQRAFLVREGVYDIAAFIENPNSFFSARKFSYTFSVYDRDDKLITTVSGRSFANARERFIVFEPQVRTGSAIPQKVFIEIKNIEWERVTGVEKPRLLVKDESLTLEGRPKMTATIINEAPERLPQVEAVATIFNEEDNVIGVSSTIVRDLEQGIPRRIFFTWPEAFKEAPRVCLRPVETMLVFDRSGSMNDDSSDPPQPLTDAKNAAKIFVNGLSSRDQAGLVSFATYATDPVDQKLTNDVGAVKDAITDIAILPEDETGYTNLGDGIRKAFQGLLDAPTNDKNPKKVIVALTDGKANYPENPGGEIYARAQAHEAKQSGIEIYTIGLGAGAKGSQKFLQDDIASTPSNYFFSATTKELAGIYGKIAEDVCPEKIYLTSIFVRLLDNEAR